MKATVYPGQATGTIDVPPSKSLAHRAIICASLSRGKSIISNLDYSDDILATISCMKELGAEIIEIESSVKKRNTIEINGIPNIHEIPDCTLDCHESGSTLRFLIPIVALSSSRITLVGKNRLLYRPQSVYESLFKQQNVSFNHTTSNIVVQGPLKSNAFQVNGDVSSQFISGLLFALPLLDKDSSIKVEFPYESKSYVDLTIQTLHRFGIKVTESAIYNEVNDCIGWQYHIDGNQSYQACSFEVEGDYSQLAFFGVLGAINSSISCTGVRSDSLQGDQAILSFLEQCGAFVKKETQTVTIQPGTITGTTIDVQDCPDLGPILMVLGMYADGNFRLINTARLRIKESDRVEAMADGLRKLGVSITVSDNEVTISNPKIQLRNNDTIVISGYKDHRIVMSFAIAATKWHQEITITDAEAISKSYPDFWNDLQSLGVEVVLHD